MIDENKLVANIQELFVTQTRADGRNYQDELINSYNEALFDVLKTIDEQPKEQESEWCKDLSHCSKWRKDDYVYKLEKALDKACEELERDVLFFKDLNFSKGIVQDSYTKEQWKEWVMKDVE